MQEIVKPLLNWYQLKKRDLPWRMTKDPYSIWISEIMLQQTRVEAVKEYYQRFLKALPTLEDLALVDDDVLLKLWQGLGYYNRARNLKKAAIIIMEKYKGVFPNTYQDLITLPGIGAYTAGAIASIAYHEKVPAVDGNVLRVISRINNSYENIDEEKTKKKITEELKSIIPEEAGEFNQALMELGATICLPNKMPKCDECPVKKYCLSRVAGTQNYVPVRKQKKRRLIEYKTIFVFTFKDQVMIRKRPNKGLLANLYEFVNEDNYLNEEELLLWLLDNQINYKSFNNLGKSKHLFSHIEWNMIGYKIELSEPMNRNQWVAKQELKTKYSLPTALKYYYEQIIKKDLS